MADRDFEIKIRTTADTAGVKQTEAELVESLQKKSVTAPGGVGVLAPGAGSAEALSAAEQQAAIESQLQTIAQTRLELAQAQVAGEEERVSVLQNELRIRSAVLGVMRTETLTQAELNALCEAENAALAQVNAAATAASGSILTSGVNLGKARGEATMLAIELATGSFNARTFGSLLGSLGLGVTAISVAGVLAVNWIKNYIEELKKAHQEELVTATEQLVDIWR
jgi:hypothetical protein